MPRYDFKCVRCDNIFERTVDHMVTTLQCPFCVLTEKTPLPAIAIRLLCSPSVIQIH
jgi:hypothetical protein